MMLVTFFCKASGNVTMFGEVALKMLGWMGHSGTVPGAFTADEVPLALERLEQAINRQKQPLSQSRDEDSESDVSLTHRAIPLIAFLKAAVEDKCDVMWRSGC